MRMRTMKKRMRITARNMGANIGTYAGNQYATFRERPGHTHAEPGRDR